MQDLQKEKLYEWEASFRDWDRPTSKMADVKYWVRWACRKYHVTPPRIKAIARDGYSIYDPNIALIWFTRCNRNPAIALHEAAHHIMWRLTHDRYQDHGREFLGVYLWLLIEAKVAPASALYPSARTASLRFLSAEAASPLRFRRVYLKAPS